MASDKLKAQVTIQELRKAGADVKDDDLELFTEFYVDEAQDFMQEQSDRGLDPGRHATSSSSRAQIEYMKAVHQGRDPMGTSSFVNAFERWQQAARVEAYQQNVIKDEDNEIGLQGRDMPATGNHYHFPPVDEDN